MSLVCPSCMWLVLAPKALQLCTNHLVLVLCRSLWVNKACHFFLVLFRSSSTPLYPSKVLWARERAPTPCPSTIFSLGLTFESRKELGVRQIMSTTPSFLANASSCLHCPTLMLFDNVQFCSFVETFVSLDRLQNSSTQSFSMSLIQSKKMPVKR